MTRASRWHPLTRAERFFRSVPSAPDENGCLIWTGAKLASGYGTMWDGTAKRLAHRVAYELFVGPIPDGFEVDHVRARGCKSTSCVNHEHLEAVTHRENNLRSDSPAAKAARQTHCIHGHAFDARNTRINPKNGKRICRRCDADRRHEYVDRQRAAA